ncbi:MAG: hypothetical protein AB1896_10200 [Thermodesulfobacteriota bacterium]
MAEISALQGSLSELKTKVFEMAGYEERHLRWALVIKLCFLAFVAAYLGWAYASFKPVDAEFLVFMAQERINEALPEAKDQMKTRLVRMAPTAIDQVGQEILKKLPELGPQAEKAAQKILNRLGDDLEKDLLAWMSEFISGQKAVVDEMIPQGSSYEKITTLRRYLVADTQDALSEVNYAVSTAMKKHPFMAQLRRLAQGRDLTPTEELQREVLALWYLLVQQKLDEEF